MSRSWFLLLAVPIACGGAVAAVAPVTYPDRAEILGRITGPEGPMSTCPDELRISSSNRTAERWRVGGADLGITWETDLGEIAIVFGDTFESVNTTDPAVEFRDHRRNTLGFSTDRTPEDGLTITRMVEDRPGHAGELIGATPGIDVEPSVIPTAGIAIGARNYLYFMSVRSWDHPLVWTTNYSSIAYSDDHGEHWTRSAAMWPAASHFAQTALAESDGALYVLGTPAGRRGAMYLARVAPADVLDPSRYEYLGADGFHQGDETTAKPIIEAPLGELSVHRNASTGLWQLTYLNVNELAIVVRTAPSLEGPWSDETVLVERRNSLHTGGYGGFQHPWFNDGSDVVLVVSRTEPCYSTFLTRIPR